jgi:RecG-like helicase
VLKYQGSTDIVRKRMKVMTETNDGFIISEKDLELRRVRRIFWNKATWYSRI